MDENARSTSEASGVSRAILLIDADAFFVAVARRLDPDGAGQAPFLIVGGPPGRRSVVASAGYAARARGVKAGMSVDRALEICPEAMIVPVPGSACREASGEIMRVIESIVPVVQPASIDEWYADATESLGSSSTLERRRFAQDLRERILERTGLDVSIGVGTNRMVAKMAVELGKPAGIHVVPAGGEARFLRRFNVTDIPGVGPKLGEALATRGVRQVNDLLGISRDLLIEWIGLSRGRWLFDAVRGVDLSLIVLDRERRSLSRERTFSFDIRGDADLKERLREITNEATRDLRRQGFRARTVSVKVRSREFEDRGHSLTLDAPVESSRAVFQVVGMLFDRIRVNHPEPVRLLGVTLSNLIRPGEAEEQIPIFADDPTDTNMDRALDKAADHAMGS